jgi:hypothetical protein
MRFWHFTQHGQGFFEVKNQLFTTSGFSAAGPQSAVRFYGEKIPPSHQILHLNNFYLKIYLDLGDRDLTKKIKEIGQEMAFWEVT